MEKDQEYPPQQIITDVHIWNELSTSGIHPAPRHVHNAALRQNKMIVFGGYTDGSVYLKDIYEYDFERKRWRGIKALKGGQNIVGKHSASMVMRNDNMYVFAGVKHLAVKTNEFLEFDFEKLSWREIEQKGDVPAERWGHSAVMYNGEMIVFGGFGSSFMNDIHAYNFETETWRRIFPNGRQPKHRHLHTAVIYKDTMVICGGYAGSITLADLWEYDFKDNSWTHLDEYNEATNRRGHSAIVYNNKMIVFGGAADSQSVNTVYQWHLERKKWKKIEVYGPEPTVRHFHSAVLLDDSMYVFGGIFKSSNMNDLHEFPLKRKGVSDKPIGAFVDLSKLLADKKYCDVTFILEDGTTFQAHKNILCCRSEHFKAMLEGGLRESGQNMVRVPGVKEAVFKAIMQFIYTDTVTITDDIAVDLFITSDKFLLPKLKWLVEDALLRAIDKDTLPSLLELATLYSAPTLKLACEMFTQSRQRKRKMKENRPLE